MSLQHGAVGRKKEPLPGETVQQPCCVARDYNSIHQSRSVARGHEKWTLTIWMRQRFTTYSNRYGQIYGYSDRNVPYADEVFENENEIESGGR